MVSSSYLLATRVRQPTFFFFSSRRRHTRWPRDWSSDVCSSDLRRDRRLVDEPEKAAIVAAGLGRRPLRRSDDIADQVEGQAAVRAEGDRDGVFDLEEIAHEQIAELIEGEGRIAARVTEVVLVADQLAGPRCATVEADCLEHAGVEPG